VKALHFLPKELRQKMVDKVTEDASALTRNVVPVLFSGYDLNVPEDQDLLGIYGNPAWNADLLSQSLGSENVEEATDAPQIGQMSEE